MLTLKNHVFLQDSLTAEDFAYSEGLPGNKNNYTLTYRWAQKILSSCAPNPYIVILGFFVQKIKVYPDNAFVCSGVGTSITTGRTEFGPTHAGSLPNSEYFVFPFSFSFRLQQNL